MSKGLLIASWAAAGGKRSKAEDRRRRPRCNEEGCRKAVELNGDGSLTLHCFLHMSDADKTAYYRTWEEPAD